MTADERNRSCDQPLDAGACSEDGGTPDARGGLNAEVMALLQAWERRDATFQQQLERYTGRFGAIAPGVRGS